MAGARTGDPWTSHHASAARNSQHTRDCQAIIYQLLDGDPMTDGELWEILQYWEDPKFTPSGARTRRDELTKLGIVEDSGETRPTPTGRPSIIWRVVDLG